MKYDAIYFDLDGTLWETTHVTYLATKEISEKYNIDIVPEETVAASMGTTKDECADMYYPNETHERAVELLEESLELASKKLAVEGGYIYEGMEETLEELSKNYKLGIVSNCLEGYIEAFMISSKLGKYFNDIVAAGKKDIKKSDAIKLAIERDGVRNAIYVGDTHKDKEAAKGAGLEFIHARYGFEPDLENKYHIATIKELPLLLKTME